MKFKKYNLVFNKNGYFNGEIVTNGQFTYEDFSHEKPDLPIVTSSMYFFVGYSEDTGRFSDLFIKGKDADSRSYNFRWDGSRFLPAEGNTEIDLINSGFVKDYSEVEEWDSFVAELNKFQKILMKEVDRNVIKDLKTQSDKFTQTCEFQSLLADKMTNVDAKTKALIKSLFEQDCTMEKIELIARDDLNAEQCCEIYFGIVSDLSLEELEIYAKPEFQKLLFASYYKDVHMRPQRREAPAGLIAQLEAAGFDNVHDDLETEFWLVRADRSMPELALLKSMYTAEERQQLARLLHRIEYGVQLPVQVAAFWQFYDDIGLFPDYTAAFIHETVFHHAQFYRQLASGTDAAHAEALAAMQAQEQDMTDGQGGEV